MARYGKAGACAVRIPRTTCRLFGAIKALSLIKNCIVLVHGPKGCVYHINYILGMRGGRPSHIYSTCLDEHDIVFGAEGKLGAAIAEIEAAHRPGLIAVLSCCASSIIGEDVRSVAGMIPVSGRIITISTGGFEGDHHAGYRESLLRLVEEFARPQASIDPRAVNLIGLLRGGPDLRELVRVLSTIGVRVNTALTAGATVEDIARIPSAALNILICEPAGKGAVEYLSRQFGMPFLKLTLPIGREATLQFLGEVGRALGVAGQPEAPPMPAPSPVFVPGRHRIAIVGGPTRAIAFCRFLRDLGTVPVLIAVDFASEDLAMLRERAGPECMLLIEPEEEELEAAIRERGVDLVLGGMLERPITEAMGIRHIDVMHGCASTLGFEGAETLCRMLRDLCAG
jgi:nitrogenase molybdenum-iron protein alpha/beta subunit